MVPLPGTGAAGRHRSVISRHNMRVRGTGLQWFTDGPAQRTPAAGPGNHA